LEVILKLGDVLYPELEVGSTPSEGLFGVRTLARRSIDGFRGLRCKSIVR
jgi:hypothetical protein